MLAMVEPDSPADKSGLLLGDIIVALAHSPVRHHDDLLALLSLDRVGSTVTARIIRGGQLEEINLTVGERE